MAQKKFRVLVTGAAGFIGSELVRQLIDRGADVTGIDNLVNGKLENLSGIPSQNFRFIKTDICRVEKWQSALKQFDVLYHLACLGVRHSIHSPARNHEVNATGTLKLLLAAKQERVKRFVYVSSSEVYGTAKRAPMNEAHPTFPLTAYGASKMAGECYARAFFETYRYPTVVVRPFNAFGARCHHEGDSGEVIPKFVLRAMAEKPLVIFGDGRQTRDFTHVSDVARGILQAGMSAKAIGQTVNLGSGREISIGKLAQTVCSLFHRKKTLIKHDAARPGDVRRLCADISRAKQLFGYQPKLTFTDGLKQLIRWYELSGFTAEQLLRDETLHNWKGTK